MRPLLLPDEMAEADRAVISSGTPASMLMERAGKAVARTVVALAGGRYGKKVTIVCGPGSNGGDGFAAARALAAEGLAVGCVAIFDPDDARGAAAEHLAKLSGAGVRVTRLPSGGLSVQDADVVVDAIFGTGFRGHPEGAADAAIRALAEHERVVAVDIPSGVDGATGRVEGAAVQAQVTVALAAEKVGTALSPGSLHAGRVDVVDIGIPVPGTGVQMLEREDVARSLPRRRADAHKRSGGSVAILAGSDEMRGAALLCARGALRMGAGYVTLGSTTAVKDAAAVSNPELLVVDLEGECLGPGSLEPFAEVLGRADALGIGPGLGRGDRQTRFVERVLEEVDLPLVVDADALNALAGRTGPLSERTAPTVLTPHPAELARLLGVGTEEVTGDRLAAARAAAERLGPCVVLLKGHRTIVASSGGAASVVIPTGGPELATAGTGDVLTGAIAALLAGGAPDDAAAWSAAYVHGWAGSLAGESRGAAGAVAWDVAEALPAAAALCRDPAEGSL